MQGRARARACSASERLRARCCIRRPMRSQGAHTRRPGNVDACAHNLRAAHARVDFCVCVSFQRGVLVAAGISKKGNLSLSLSPYGPLNIRNTSINVAQTCDHQSCGGRIKRLFRSGFARSSGGRVGAGPARPSRRPRTRQKSPPAAVMTSPSRDALKEYMSAHNVESVGTRTAVFVHTASGMTSVRILLGTGHYREHHPSAQGASRRSRTIPR